MRAILVSPADLERVQREQPGFIVRCDQCARATPGTVAGTFVCQVSRALKLGAELRICSTFEERH